jgi:hypothetical protein
MSRVVLVDAFLDADGLDIVTLCVVVFFVLDAVAVLEIDIVVFDETDDAVFGDIDVVVTGGSDKHEHALEIRCDKGVLTAMFASATSRALD